MTAALAFYKGPPKRNDWLHTISHYAIRLWTWSKYSHAEIVIDGVCYSSSSRDGGIRKKEIDLYSGRWDIVYLNIPKQKARQVLEWFNQHDGDKYDYLGIVRFVLPFIPHSKNKRFCFEAIGESLGFAGSHKLTANDLYEWALKNSE